MCVSLCMCECVCVCKRERHRHRKRERKDNERERAQQSGREGGPSALSALNSSKLRSKTYFRGILNLFSRNSELIFEEFCLRADLIFEEFSAEAGDVRLYVCEREDLDCVRA